MHVTVTRITRALATVALVATTMTVFTTAQAKQQVAGVPRTRTAIRRPEAEPSGLRDLSRDTLDTIGCVGRRIVRWALQALAALVGILAVALAAIALALVITPPQTVAAPGRPIQVGAVPPSLTLSGPAELRIDDRTVPTALQLAGPVRPLIEVSRTTINSLVARAEQSPQHGAGLKNLGSDVETAWVHYLLWQFAAVALVAFLIAGGVIGWDMILRSQRRVPARHFRRNRIAASAICVLVAVGLDGAGLVQMPHTLSQVRSLTDLFGSEPVPTIAAFGPALTDVHALVIGDSTAAGMGNPPVDSPTTEDMLCQRSRDSYAADLGAVTGWKVLNLACSGATIADGVVGSQHIGDQTLPPQVAILKQASSASYVFVSIGANDLQMGAMVGVCVAVHECSDPAQAALFQAELDAFTHSYSQLLKVLATLPSKPTVVINVYYDALGNGTCAHKLLDASSVSFLRSWFDAMNTTLADGAQLFDFVTATPNFAGHQYCDPHPYVQDLSSNAPLHPNIAGELSIALADLQALYRTGSGIGVPS